MKHNPFMSMVEGKVFGGRGHSHLQNPPINHPIRQSPQSQAVSLGDYIPEEQPPAPKREANFVIQPYFKPSEPVNDQLVREFKELRRDILSLKSQPNEVGKKSIDEVVEDKRRTIASDLDRIEGENSQILEQINYAMMFNTPKGDKSWEELRGMFHEGIKGGFYKESLDIAVELVEGAKVLYTLFLQQTRNYERMYWLVKGENQGDGLVGALESIIDAREKQIQMLKEKLAAYALIDDKDKVIEGLRAEIADLEKELDEAGGGEAPAPEPTETQKGGAKSKSKVGILQEAAQSG